MLNPDITSAIPHREPFLFVDEMTAEMPQAVGANDGIGRMHVQLALSGEWQGAAR